MKLAVVGSDVKQRNPSCMSTYSSACRRSPVDLLVSVLHHQLKLFVDPVVFGLSSWG